MVAETRRRVVFALDQSKHMAQLDPQRLRVQGIHKLLQALGPADAVGFIQFHGATQTSISPAPAASVGVESIGEAASADSAATVSTDLQGALGAALAMAGDGSDGVLRTVILISSARTEKGEDIDVATADLRRSVDSYAEAGVTLYAIAFGPFSDRARALASMLARDPNLALIENGNGLPAAFGDILTRLQGHGKRPRIARLDPDAGSHEERELDQAIRIAPHTEMLQLDVTSQADPSGVIPFSIALVDSSGALVPPTWTGVGNAFYRIAHPMQGEWRYIVTPDRRGRITHHVVTDVGLKIVHYYPSVVERGKDIPLHFSVFTPHGAPTSDAFGLGGFTYKIVGADVTFVAPNGRSEIVSAEHQDRQSPFAGEFTIADWQGDMAGAYDVDIVVYLTRERRPDADIFTLRNHDPISIRVVDDRGQLPLVALASVTPRAGRDAPIPLEDAQGRAHLMAFTAEVLSSWP